MNFKALCRLIDLKRTRRSEVSRLVKAGKILRRMVYAEPAKSMRRKVVYQVVLVTQRSI